MPAEHPLDLVATLRVVEVLDRRVRRVTRHLLDTEVAVGNTRDLRQVRDGDHLRAAGEPLQGLGDAVGRLATDPRVDLVEDESLATRHGRKRERNTGQLAARCGLGDRTERQSLVRPDLVRRFVTTRRAGRRITHVDTKLAVSHPKSRQLGDNGRRERLGSTHSRCAEPIRKRLVPRLGGGDLQRCRSKRVLAAIERGQLDDRRRTLLEKLRRRLAAEAAARVRQPIETSLDLLQPAGIGLERGEVAMEVAPGVSEPEAKRKMT